MKTAMRAMIGAAAAMLLSGCLTAPLPHLSQGRALATANTEARRIFPTADLSQPRAVDLGDRWEVTYAQPTTATPKPVIVVDARGPAVIRSFDFR
jgi:hypothetical protein